VVGVGAAAGGDVGVAGEVEGSSDEVADACQDGGEVAGADLVGVLAEDDIPDPVNGVLHRLVAPGPSGEFGRGGLFGGQVGDGVDGFGAPPFRFSGVGE
jgi:hypothetical protein